MTTHGILKGQVDITSQAINRRKNMTIEKEGNGSPYYVATYKGQQFLGYSFYEALCRCLEAVWKH